MVYRNSRPAGDDEFDDGTVYSDADSYYSRSDVPANAPWPALSWLMARPIL
jgi:hypothetical protein